MSRAMVDSEGRLRLPDDVRRAAGFEPGRELDVVLNDGVLTVFTDTDSGDEPVSDSFLRDLADALNDVREGRTTAQDSDEAFLRELHRRSDS